MVPSGKDSSKTKKTGTNVPEGERMRKIKKMPLSADIGTTQPEDVVEFPSMLKAWADEAAALEARLEAYECLQKSSQAKIEELGAERTMWKEQALAYGKELERRDEVAYQLKRENERLQKGETIESDYLTEEDDPLIEALALEQLKLLREIAKP